MTLLATIAVIVLLAACGNGESNDNNDSANAADGNNHTNESSNEVNADGMPIVEETVEMDVFAPKPPQHKNNDWNDILVWNTYKDLTNVDVNWEMVDWDAREEK